MIYYYCKFHSNEVQLIPHWGTTKCYTTEAFTGYYSYYYSVGLLLLNDGGQSLLSPDGGGGGGDGDGDIAKNPKWQKNCFVHSIV